MNLHRFSIQTFFTLIAVLLAASACSPAPAPDVTTTVTTPGITVTQTNTVTAPGTTITQSALPVTLTETVSPATVTVTETASPTISDKNIQGKVYTNQQYGISLTYPQDWATNEGASGSIVFLEGPSNANQRFATISVYVGTLSASSGTTLQEYAISGDAKLAEKLTDFVHLEEFSTTIGGLPAVVHTFTFSLNGGPLKQGQALVQKGNQVFVLTYTSIPEEYDQYRLCFVDVLTSLQFD